ncbi:MAG TPA: hypothetical protein VF139_02610 [Candidatus Polarisedimenticolaceae bacterium]
MRTLVLSVVFSSVSVVFSAPLRLIDPSPSVAGGFGAAVAVSGSLAFVGAPGSDDAGEDAGAVHVYADGVYVQTIHGPSKGARFGTALAASGPYLVVGAPNSEGSGEVRVFEGPPGAMRETAALRPDASNPGMRFGDAVAIEGGTIVVGAPLASSPMGPTGMGFVFERSPEGGFVLQQRLIAIGIPSGGGLGASVAIRAGRIAMGAPYLAAEFLPGRVATFLRTSGGWVRGAEVRSPVGTPRDRFGRSVALVNGELLVGAPRDLVLSRGLLCTFRPRTAPGGDETWESTDVQLSPDAAPFDRFGFALETDGNRMVVGAPSAEPGGRAWVYRLEQGRWVADRELVADVSPGFTLYGAKVGISGRTVVVGAQLDDGVAEDAGAAFLFDVGE